MTHIVHPYSHRLGIIRDWRSRWFRVGKDYRTALKTDLLLREYLDKRLRGMYVAGVEIERGQKALRIAIKTSRPGMIIGRSGEGAAKLKNELLATMRKAKIAIPEDLKVDIVEVTNPDADAAIAPRRNDR